MGRDTFISDFTHMIFRFQSTLPAWGETVAMFMLFYKERISIHSPRMGRDMGFLKQLIHDF